MQAEYNLISPGRRPRGRFIYLHHRSGPLLQPRTGFDALYTNQLITCLRTF